jgi:hypothetical protein
VRGPTPARLYKYCCQTLGLKAYFRDPGDGRITPQIPASVLLWALLLGKVLRVASFHGLEELVRLGGRGMGVPCSFGDDTLGYFTERLSAARLRATLAGLLGRARRNKAFARTPLIGLALDGTGAGRSQRARCTMCQRQGQGHGHKFSAISLVGTDIELPFDIEPYGPGDSEQAASARLLRRAAATLGSGFANYVVVDALYANAPFLHLAGELGFPVIASLKANLPELFEAARARFRDQPPQLSFAYRGGSVDLWDEEGLEPWLGLHWSGVRVLRYQHRRADGKIFNAYWLTNLSVKRVGPRALFHLCKSRWEIENQGFNDAKNRYGLEHIPHHHPASILINALLTLLAMCVERIYRLRNLRRGTHRPPTAIGLMRQLWLSLGSAQAFDTS